MGDLLTERYANEIKGTLTCFDRLVFFGSFQEIAYSGAMDHHLWSEKIQYVDYVKYADRLRLDMVDHVKAVAGYYNVDITFVNQDVRKEDLVAEKLKKRGRRKGIACILSAIESCRCYKVKKDHQTGYLRLRNSPGKCLHYYIYLFDEELGLTYLRIPTWAPFRLQLYFNGHDWLERQMKREGIRFKKKDNTFTHISDFEKANELAKNMDPQILKDKFDQIARQWVGVFDRFHGNIIWSIYQAELATDIVFKNDRLLPGIYRDIVRTAVCEFQCKDVYQFLGKRLMSKAKEYAESRMQTLIQGTRIKHTLKSNSIKMYDKQNQVLRIETTTSDVSSFYCYRRVVSQDGTCDFKCATVRKAITSLPEVFKQLSACNRRYHEAISQMEDRTEQKHKLSQIVESKRDSKGRSCRGVNFFKADDLLFINAILQGQHHIMGLRNNSLQPLLKGWSAQKIGRYLRRFRELGLLKRVAGTIKYYTTKLGKDVIAAGLQLKDRVVLPALNAM